jgi:hypothetical protein
MQHQLPGTKGKDNLKVIGMWTYETFLSETEYGKHLPLANLSYLNKLLVKTDHIVHVRVNTDRHEIVKHFDLYVMVRVTADKPSVIGFLSHESR